jgi:predicted nucleic acid-binding protein
MRVDDVPACIVIDASLGLKWVFQEQDSEQATALGKGRELVTSALFWPEAANAIATRVRRGDITRVEGDDAFRDLQAAPLQTRRLHAEGVRSALAIAHDLAHPIYDCCYLAVAMAEDAIVVTADRRFRLAATRLPSLTDRVLLLRDITLS